MRIFLLFLLLFLTGCEPSEALVTPGWVVKQANSYCLNEINSIRTIPFFTRNGPDSIQKYKYKVVCSDGKATILVPQ